MSETEDNSQIEACESYYSIADIGLTNHAFIAPQNQKPLVLSEEFETPRNTTVDESSYLSLFNLSC
jgi:hypothetical protein